MSKTSVSPAVSAVMAFSQCFKSLANGWFLLTPFFGNYVRRDIVYSELFVRQSCFFRRSKSRLYCDISQISHS
jgi:hypothetical protein